MTGDKVRVILVGAGRIALAHAEAVAACDAAVLVGVADLHPAAAAALGAQAGGVASATDSVALAHETGAQLAIVCTPPATHEQLTISLLEAGVAVVCEKPFALNVPSAAQMLQVSQRERVLCTMASKFRFVADVTQARALIAAGTLGEPVLLQNVFSSPVTMSERWNADRDVAGGGVLIDNATHSVDIVRYLFGPITEVLATEASRVQPVMVEDTAKLLARTARGALADIDVSWSVDRRLESFLWIQGTDAELRIGWSASAMRRSGSDTWDPIGPGYQKVAAMSAQIEEVCSVLLGRGELRIDGEDALSSVQVLQAAYQSMSTKSWQAVSTRESVLQ